MFLGLHRFLGRGRDHTAPPSSVFQYLRTWPRSDSQKQSRHLHPCLLLIAFQLQTLKNTHLIAQWKSGFPQTCRPLQLSQIHGKMEKDTPPLTPKCAQSWDSRRFLWILFPPKDNPSLKSSGTQQQNPSQARPKSFLPFLNKKKEGKLFFYYYNFPNQQLTFRTAFVLIFLPVCLESSSLPVGQSWGPTLNVV